MFNSRLYDVPSYPQTTSADIPHDLKKIWDTQQQLAKAENDLEEVMSQRSNTPIRSIGENQAMNQEIERLHNIITTLKKEIQQRDIRISQQTETIKVHSNELSKFANRDPKRYEASPIRLPSYYAQPQNNGPSQYNVPPPVFNPRGQLNVQAQEFHPPSRMMTPAPPQPTFQSKWGTIQNDAPVPSPLTQTSNNLSFDGSPIKERRAMAGRGSPLPIAQMRSMSFRDDGSGQNSGNSTPPRPLLPPIGTRPQPSLTPATSNGSDGNMMPPVPTHTPVRSMSVVSQPRSLKDAVVSPTQGSQTTTIDKDLSGLFDLATRFAYDFVNFPSNLGDSTIPQDLKNALLNLATSTTAHRLMSDQKTRYCMVTKVILDWMMRNIFREEVFAAGLDPEKDSSILITIQKMASNPPVKILAVYKRDLCRQFAALTKLPNYENFMKHKINQRATELFQWIRPMMYQKKDEDFIALYKVVQEAHRVAEKLVQDFAEYRFYFPRVNEKYNSASMMNTDADFSHMSPDDIGAQHGLVKLGWVPQIMYQYTELSGEIYTGTLMKAAVLIKFPDRERR